MGVYFHRCIFNGNGGIRMNESHRSNVKVDTYYKKRSKEEMKHVMVTFSLMIFLTLSSFFAVAYPTIFPKIFSVPFILLLACVQVLFQLYYFMHMKQRGHQTAIVFLYTALFIGLLTVLAFATIVWI